MALASGTRLGPYEILSALGAGGMGEVYRACDRKLDRDVAIKVLPESVANDSDRLARFEREAKTLAALNHPNIAHIHGLEESNGVRALVMELVEGEDLSQRIARGAIPIDEALPIAKQIAEALEAAHEQGIIHRDLKPANIKVREDGTVKVLDFGLAKALDPVSSATGMVTNSPTLSLAATQAGVILGTAAYMAPEQARGKAMDKRADIWAFGAVLFEMVSGRQAFAGETLSETLAEVMKSEPPWEAIPASVPAFLVRLIRHCLVKDPRQRIRDMGDVRLALDGAFEAVPQTTQAGASTMPRGRGLWTSALVVAAIAIVALAIPAARYLRQTGPPAPPEMRTDIVTPATDQPSMFALSPDGLQIVFVASSDGAPRLWLRPLASTMAQPLAGSEGATFPFWSPDSRSIGFFAGPALKRFDLVGTGGGAPQTLAPVASGQGGTWNTDGVIVYAPSTTTALMRVSAAGGPAVAATTLGPGEQGHIAPSFLPDGRRFLFRMSAGPEGAGIYLGNLDGGAPTRLTPNGNAGVFLRDGLRSTEASGESGWVLWLRADRLMAQRLDVAKAAFTSDPLTLANGVDSVSAAATGLVAYRTAVVIQRQLTWMDRSGKAQGTVGDPDGTLRNPRVSPDGRRVIVSRTVQGNEDLWLIDGTRQSRFTFDPGSDRFPVWSPDGNRIVFYSTRTGGGDLYMKLASGAGPEERLPLPEQFKLATSWSRDGRFLLYQRTDPLTNSDLWVTSMVDHTSSVLLKTPAFERFGTISPDGRWVAYHSNESGRNEIYVRAFAPPGSAQAGAAAGGQWQVSTAGGVFPAWRSDGTELYFLNQAGAMMAAPITVTGSTLAPGAPVVLFPTRVYGGGVDNQLGPQYDVARDGRFLVNTVLDSATAPITLLMNWQPPAQK